MTPYVEKLLEKERWRRSLHINGYEGKPHMASERLAEALRTELREILDNSGKPFDLNIARHVYDFAIAARDLLVASSKGVEATIKIINDVNGPMESLTSPNDPIPAEQASETFGARMMREILATLPLLMKKPDDPKKLVHALAEARMAGMDDVARELEVKLFGHVLTPEAPTPEDLGKLTQKFLDRADKKLKVETNADGVEVATGGYEHGFADGLAGAPKGHSTSDYHEGYTDGVNSRPNGIGTANSGEAAVGSYAQGLVDGRTGVPRRYGTTDYLCGYMDGAKAIPRSENEESPTWHHANEPRPPSRHDAPEPVCTCGAEHEPHMMMQHDGQCALFKKVERREISESGEAY